MLIAATLPFILILTLPMTCINHVHAVSDENAVKLADAENAVNHAFTTVLDAEQAGANVSELLIRLNDAADLLAQAENALRSNGNAVVNVDGAVSIASDVEAAAISARDKASADSTNSLQLNIVFSTVGSVALIVVLWLVWRRFKVNYVKNLSDAKPEVNGQ